MTQAKPAPGNRSEVRTSQSECQKRNSTTCRSPTIDTSRKSSRTFGKKLNLAEVAPVIGIESLKTNVLTWRLCMSITMKAAVPLGPNYETGILAPETEIMKERNIVVKNQGTKQRGQIILGDCWQWKPTGSVPEETIAVSVTMSINVQKLTQPNPSPSSFMQQNERNASRTRSPRGKSPSGRMFRWPCKDYLKGTCTNSFCEKWHPSECLFYKSESGCRFGEKCSYAHRQVDEQPSKRSKKNGDKSAEAMLKKHEQHDRTGRPVVYDSSNTRQLGCVFQDMEPQESSSICGRAQTYGNQSDVFD